MGDQAIQRVHIPGTGHEGLGACIAGLQMQEGLILQQHRVRDCLLVMDPIGMQTRWAKYIEPWRYYVPWVNSLWHIDGHHKLIDWKIVIHTGIDGKSRLITFICASNNNRANTVFEIFMDGVKQYKVPSWVHSDYGKENFWVRDHMEAAQGHHLFWNLPTAHQDLIAVPSFKEHLPITNALNDYGKTFRLGPLTTIRCYSDIWLRSDILMLRITFIPGVCTSASSPRSIQLYSGSRINGTLMQCTQCMQKVPSASSSGVHICIHFPCVLSSSTDLALSATRSACCRSGSGRNGLGQVRRRRSTACTSSTIQLRKLRSSDDPHILVNKPAAYIDTQICKLLESMAYRDWLSKEIDPQDPNSSDLGEDRFLRCLVIVDPSKRDAGYTRGHARSPGYAGRCEKPSLLI